MKELTVEELKAVELAILKTVAEFCDKHGLRYYLCGGTLLGAVRHKGFIPWDDDIDILMPRPDYMHFVRMFNGTCPFYIVKSIENDATYWRTFAKVFDLRTFLKENAIRMVKKDNGAFIDIFPVDGLPARRWRQWLLFKEQEFLNFLYHGSAWNYTRSFKYDDSQKKYSRIKGRIRTVLKFIAITFLHPLPTYRLIRLINKNAMRNPYENSEEVAAIVDCHYGGAKERMPKELFEIREPIVFEKQQFWISGAWQLYLRNLYGDYMALPPEEKRVTHHDFKVYWRNDMNAQTDLIRNKKV